MQFALFPFQAAVTQVTAMHSCSCTSPDSTEPDFFTTVKGSRALARQFKAFSALCWDGCKVQRMSVSPGCLHPCLMLCMGTAIHRSHACSPRVHPFMHRVAIWQGSAEEAQAKSSQVPACFCLAAVTGTLECLLAATPWTGSKFVFEAAQRFCRGIWQPF